MSVQNNFRSNRHPDEAREFIPILFGLESLKAADLMQFSVCSLKAGHFLMIKFDIFSDPVKLKGFLFNYLLGDHMEIGVWRICRITPKVYQCYDGWYEQHFKCKFLIQYI